MDIVKYTFTAENRAGSKLLHNSTIRRRYGFAFDKSAVYSTVTFSMKMSYDVSSVLSCRHLKLILNWFLRGRVKSLFPLNEKLKFLK